MARRSQRLSTGEAATSSPQHKRSASDTGALSVRTKKAKIKATPTKSTYFKDSTKTGKTHNDLNDNDNDSDGGDETATSATNDENESEFDDDDEEDLSSQEEDDDEYDSDMDDTPRSRKKVTPAKKGSTSKNGTPNTGELWRPGVKAGLGPGTQVVIKKPQPRPAGKTPYRDDTIHPNTLLFLSELKANNERQWLKMHDAVFRQAEKDWYSFVDKLTEKLIEVDDTVPELPVKDVIFRIYRDIRFSPDPTPYKAHFSAAWSRTGRKGGYAHYYVQISPGNNSFVGGGLWHPEAAPTAAMRRDIDRHPERIKAVLMEERMRKEFLRGAAKNEAKAVAAFVSANSENALKTKPKGFDADHKEISLLRLRNYTIGRKLTEDEVVGADGLECIARLFSAMKPFITYLNSIVMPDEEASESSEDSDEGGEEEDEE